MNVNIEIQYDSPKEEMDTSRPLSFAQIAKVREDVNAPKYATIQFEEEAYGWEIRIHWNTDVRER